MDDQICKDLKGLSEKIAIELIFAEPGKDLGLLPVNWLLGQIEETLSKFAAPDLLKRGLEQAKKWMDAAFESTGTFSEVALKRFGEWVPWWQSAVNAFENEAAAEPLPAHWCGETQKAGAKDATAANEKKPAPLEEPVVVLNLEQDRDLLTEFINESQEHLLNIEQGVLVLEENPTDEDTLNSIFRAFHTFKGGSGFLHLAAIQNVAHELESLLDQARQNKLVLTPQIINLILAGGDTLKQFVGEIANQTVGKRPAAPIVVPTLALLDSIRDVLNGDNGAPAIMREDKARDIAVPDPDPVMHPIIEASPTVPAEPSSKPATAATNRNKAASVGTAVKVDTVKLDSLVDLVGEMVIAQSLVVQNPDLAVLQSEQLTRDLAHLGRISKDLQRTAMSLRMVPIRATFQKMQRLVRDLAAKVGKHVELVTEGEDTELDRTIVEEISDPLIHMVRNSIDHGIEKPEIRQQQGKPPHGTIWLKAFHRGGNIVIEIKDDGGGLNREKIFAKAVERGLVMPGEQLPDDELYGLIMAAGFSTAEKVTDLSGRGVGMDVVRRNVEKLRGKIEIRSTSGQGSTFSIHLPLTLAIIDGLIVGVGAHRYIVPTLLTRESFRPNADMIKTVHGRGEMINLRGRLCPLVRLYSYLNVEPASTEPTQSIVVVVEAGSETRCLLVDTLLGKQEVVIKSLGETFRDNRYMAGAAILGDGRVGLILDPQSLTQSKTAVRETTG